MKASQVWRSIRWYMCFLGWLAGMSLVAVTARAQGITVSPMLVEANLSPGQQHTETVRIENSTMQAMRVAIVPADFVMDGSGAVDLLDFGSSPYSLANRLAVSAEELLIDPGEVARVSVSIACPVDAVPGSRWGCLVVEAEGGSGILGAGDASVAVRTRFVVALLQRDSRIRSREGDVTAMEVEVLGRGAGRTPAAIVAATFKNTCSDILTVDVRFEVRDLFGVAVGIAQIEKRVVLPGSKREFRVQLPATGWSPGQYLALAIVDFGGERLAGGQWPFEILEVEQGTEAQE